MPDHPPAPTALIVDDDPWVRAPLHALLDTLGFEVREAVDGESAIAALRAAPDAYAFVLLDVRLPRLGCDEVLAGLLGARRDLPVLLHTGFDQWQLPPALFAAGRVGYLGKPAGLAELVAALQRLQVEVPLPVVA
ncbi:MAG: response regulator transcription factor [Pseudomonadota bacterium]|nr:response regulator transcription factor [Pseudomonadota bacterium]